MFDEWKYRTLYEVTGNITDINTLLVPRRDTWRWKLNNLLRKLRSRFHRKCGW